MSAPTALTAPRASHIASGCSERVAQAAITSVDTMIPAPTPANMTSPVRRRAVPATARTSDETAIIAHALATPPSSRSPAHVGGADVAAIAAVVDHAHPQPDAQRRPQTEHPRDRPGGQRSGEVAEVVGRGHPSRPPPSTSPSASRMYGSTGV